MMISQQTKTTTADISIGSFTLASGAVLEDVTLRYERVGPSDAPVILVCHALTGNHLTVGTEAEPGWWSGLIGPGKTIDTAHYQVITFNVLGGCSGSTGPASLQPNGKPYRSNFPSVTIRDMVRAQHEALQKLNIQHIDTVIGGSLGGMQTLEWGLLFPEAVNKLIVLAATPALSDYGIAFNHIAAAAIQNDPSWNNGYYLPNQQPNGLEIARMIGMVTYRSAELFSARFNRDKTGDAYAISSYLNYQGEKLADRFDANSYLCLLDAMNHHDIGAGRESCNKALASLQLPVLTISYEKDLIYHPETIKDFSSVLPHATYHHVNTIFGHDGFLTEYDKWAGYIEQFLQFDI